MVEIILSYKWHVLIISEISGWLFTFLFIFARYWFQSSMLTWVSFLLIIMLDYVPSIGLPVMDFLYTKDVTTWITEGGLTLITITILLIVFSLTLGKKYLALLDSKMLLFVSKMKGQEPTDAD